MPWATDGIVATRPQQVVLSRTSDIIPYDNLHQTVLYTFYYSIVRLIDAKKVFVQRAEIVKNCIFS